MQLNGPVKCTNSGDPLKIQFLKSSNKYFQTHHDAMHVIETC